MPFTRTESPAWKRGSDDEMTLPETSMPALRGNRLKMGPRPVTPNASLKLMPDHSARITTSPGVRSSMPMSTRRATTVRPSRNTRQA